MKEKSAIDMTDNSDFLENELVQPHKDGKKEFLRNSEGEDDGHSDLALLGTTAKKEKKKMKEKVSRNKLFVTGGLV